MKLKTTLKTTPHPKVWIALIDIFFLSMIFFIISSSRSRYPGFLTNSTLHLPKMSSNNQVTGDNINVTITRKNDGSGYEIYLNDEKTDLDNCENIFARLVRSRREATSMRPRAAFRFDTSTPIGMAMSMMSMARKYDADFIIVGEWSTTSSNPKILKGE